MCGQVVFGVWLGCKWVVVCGTWGVGELCVCVSGVCV